MNSKNKIIRKISFIGACALAVTTARAVDPPPDGGYPNQNTAEGEDALFSLGGGFSNTAIGFHALYSLDFGNANTAIGANALSSNTQGQSNTATGAGGLFSNTTGNFNTATGESALLNNNGESNTATGASALKSRRVALLRKHSCVSAIRQFRNPLFVRVYAKTFASVSKKFGHRNT